MRTNVHELFGEKIQRAPTTSNIEGRFFCLFVIARVLAYTFSRNEYALLTYASCSYLAISQCFALCQIEAGRRRKQMSCCNVSRARAKKTPTSSISIVAQECASLDFLISQCAVFFFCQFVYVSF